MSMKKQKSFGGDFDKEILEKSKSCEKFVD